MNFKYSMDLDMQLYRYSEYMMKKIDEKKYIFPAEEAHIVENDINKDFSEILIELLNIGKSVYYNENEIEETVVNFVNHYGLLGFINYYPVNELYFLDNEIILKTSDGISEFLVKNDIISYIRIFMPNLLNQDVVDKLETVISAVKSNMVSENVRSILNMNFIYSHDYGEPLEMITNYAKHLYEDLLNIQNEYETNMNIKQLVTSFDNNGKELILKVEYLKNAVDAVFISEALNETRRLKICKYCGKPFMAVNPKAEYDTPQCKNKANVYKFRSKEK